MPPVVNPLSFEEHRELGRELLRSRARLIQLETMAATVYGPQSRPAFQFSKVNEAMAQLCKEMAAQAVTDCPGLDTSGFYRDGQT